MRVFRNPRALGGPYPAELRRILSREAHHIARGVIESWPGHQPTPLHSLPQTAEQLGIERLWLKDESHRFGLGAFKSLGGAYAVYSLLAERILALRPTADVSAPALLRGDHRDVTAQVTIACASAGNHGRAVAWGAQLFGARCVVYLYEDVSPGRGAAIEAFGATVDRTPPNYDEAVRRVANDAARNGWLIVSDTAYPGYMEIPRTVMQGYTVIAQEALDQLAAERPTHVFLQAGVGGFVAAMSAHLWESLGDARPTMITVEPAGAACVLASLEAGHTVTVPDVESIMGGLCSGEVSLLAWEILLHASDYAIAIPDSWSLHAMRRLAQPLVGEPAVIAGESGAAGFAALSGIMGSDASDRSIADLRASAGLGRKARVLLFVTEGATDRETWMRYTNLPLPQSSHSARSRTVDRQAEPEPTSPWSTQDDATVRFPEASP
jgi:diaminopropionate ammonia-lyase